METKTESNINQYRSNEAAKTQDTKAGMLRQRKAKAAMEERYTGFLQIARRIAREIGQNGPLTIEDVTAVMARTENVLPSKTWGERNWRGRVFNSEFVCVGSKPAATVSSHGRLIKLWALKSWLNGNPANGTSFTNSSFRVAALHSIFVRSGGVPRLWRIGMLGLSRDIEDMIYRDKGQLYGIPVEFIVNMVGATLEA